MARSLGVMFKQLMSSLFSKPATFMYPGDRHEPPARFRGRLVWHDEQCIRCNLCVRDCPGDALELVEREDGSVDAKGKPMKDLVAKMERCIYCGQCAWVCPKDAISFEQRYELATMDKTQVKMITIAAPAQAAEDKEPVAE